MKQKYKKTEIGVIPEDWEITTLEKEYELFAGGDLNTDDYSDVKTSKYQYAILSNGLQNNGVYGFCSRPKYCGNAVTITGRGDIGHCVYRENAFSAIIRLLVCQPRKQINSKFISEYLESTKPFVFESTGVPQLTVPQIKNTLIPLPPFAEQNRIAEALSDIDELISSLEKLIAKKKAIKQGTMQQLLTGKTRLSGYTDKWNQNTFGELFDVLPNNAYTRDQLSVGGSIKNIHYGDILTKYGAVLDGQSKTIPTLSSDLEKKKRPESQFVHSGDIIIADTAEDETVGKAVELYNVNCKILSGQHTFFCHPKVTFTPMFLGYYMNSTEFHSQMLPYITGTKVSSISKQSLNMLVLRYPRKEEQEVISKILYEMDCEIEALGKKLEKVVQNKKGMMQQLLTGKIRLM